MLKSSLFLPYILFFSLIQMHSIFADSTLFEDTAVPAGIQSGINLPQMGVACGDYDNDGFTDIFVAGDNANHPKNRLFHNLGNGKFAEVGVTAGVTEDYMVSYGGAWGDFDGDSDLDLFVCNGDLEEDSPSDIHLVNRLFRNDGNQKFTDVAPQAGVSGLPEDVTQPWVSAAWADYNRDGYLDLIACNRFSGIFLFRNNGNGTFQNVTASSGLPGMDKLPSAEQASWADYDNDGDLDLFITVAVSEAMEHHMPGEEDDDDDVQPDADITRNFLFENQGDGAFINVTDYAGVGDPNKAFSNSAVWADYDNDGDLDLFVGNNGSTNASTAVNSRLYRNNGNKTFTDVADAAGITDLIYAFNAAWVDINNDGNLDLSACYHPSHIDYPEGVLYPVPHPVYLSNGDGAFTNINKDSSDAITVTGMTDISHLVGDVWFDMENDGDLDAIFTDNHGDGPIRLYQNQTAAAGNHSITIRLKESGANSFAVGAKIFINAGRKKQLRTVGVGNSGWGSQEPLTQTIGLGKETSAEIQICWPDGALENFGSLAADKIHNLIKGSGTNDIHNWRKFE